LQRRNLQALFCLINPKKGINDNRWVVPGPEKRVASIGGIILWDDYRKFFPGVKPAVDELVGPDKLLKFESGIVLCI